MSAKNTTDNTRLQIHQSSISVAYIHVYINITYSTFTSFYCI